MSKSDRTAALATANESLIVTRHRMIEKLRSALHQTDPANPPAGPDDHLSPEPATRAAAVLVPIVQREDDLYLVFIRRSDHVESHRGQVAFPGGRVDPTDTTLLHTALREAHEEVGIEPEVVDVLGGFPTMSTVSSGMRVAPFVGLLRRPVDYRIQEAEVAEVFEVPLQALVDPRYQGQYEWRRDKDRPSSNFPAIFYSGQTIWGLTLRITENLLEIMGIAHPPS
jgi:8-oxo-dGTP pyrophosphatase MutT (NUDIX family)